MYDSVNKLICKLLVSAGEIRALAAEWRHLLALHPHPESFYDLAWTIAGLVDPHLNPLAPAVFEDGRLIGVLPLGLRQNQLEFIGISFADYNDLLCIPERKTEILSLMLASLRQSSAASSWHRLMLVNVRDDSLLRQALCESGLRKQFWETRAYPCPYIDFSGGKDALIAKFIAKKSLVRHAKGLNCKGVVAFEVLRDYSAVIPYLERFCEQQVIRRAASGQPSHLRHEEPRRALAGLMCDLAAQGNLRFAVLTLNGDPAAFHFGFVYGRKYYWYKPSFQIDLWDDSPGEVLIRDLLISLRGEPSVILDFTIGNEAFKGRFTNGASNTFILHHDFGWRRHLYPLAQRIRRCLPRNHSILTALLRLKRLSVQTIRATWDLLTLAKHPSKWPRFFYTRRTVIVFRAPCESRPVSLPSDCKIVIDQFAHLAHLVLQGKTPYNWNDIQKLFARLRAGDHVHVLMEQERVAHIAWSGIRTEIQAEYELGTPRALKLPEPHVLIYDCWTAPAERGRGIYSHMLWHICAYYAGQVAASTIFCTESNNSSIRGIEKAGFRRFAALSLTRWLVIGKCWRQREVSDAGSE